MPFIKTHPFAGRNPPVPSGANDGQRDGTASCSEPLRGQAVDQGVRPRFRGPAVLRFPDRRLILDTNALSAFPDGTPEAVEIVSGAPSLTILDWRPRGITR